MTQLAKGLVDAMQDTSSFTRKLPGLALGLLAAASLNLSPAIGMH